MKHDKVTDRLEGPAQQDDRGEHAEQALEKPALPARRAGVLQVARTLFFGLIMIGKKATWEKGGDGAQMTPAQIVVGALIGGVVLILGLLILVRLMINLATG